MYVLVLLFISHIQQFHLSLYLQSFALKDVNISKWHTCNLLLSFLLFKLNSFFNRESPNSSLNSSTKESPGTNPVSRPCTVSTKQTTPSSKTPNIKQLFAVKPSPAVKKRIQPLLSVPPGQSIPTQTSPSMMNFVQSSAKPVSLEQDAPSPNTKELVETEQKTKKRITPITLTTVVAKSPLAAPPVPPAQEEFIVLSD